MRSTAVAEIRCSGWDGLRQPVGTAVGAGVAAAAVAAAGYDGLDAVAATVVVGLQSLAEDGPEDDVTGWEDTAVESVEAVTPESSPVGILSVACC